MSESASFTVFRVNLSKGIMAMYWFILVIIIFAFLGVRNISKETGNPEESIFLAVFGFVVLLIAYTLVRAYQMRFTVYNSDLEIRGVFRTHRIPFHRIKEIQKSPIPFGYRLFGASFLGGFYYFPGIGRAWVAMGNFKDGVLFSTKEGRHYVITPERPLEFIEMIEKRKGMHGS